MDGPNPFVMWGESPAMLAGRKDEIRFFKSFLKKVLGKQLSLLVVQGGLGAGKSFLLSRFANDCHKQGIFPIMVALSPDDNLCSLTKKLVLASARDDLPAAGADFADLRLLLESICKSTKEYFGFVIFLDDLNECRDFESIIESIAKLANLFCGKLPIGFVLSTSKYKQFSLLGSYSLVLSSLDETEAHELVNNALKKSQIKMGQECIAAILADSSANPRIFKTICWFLYDWLRPSEKVISKGHYLAYLSSIINFLGRDWFSSIHSSIPHAEREILFILADYDNDLGISVSEISGRIKRPISQVTALLRRLLDRGVIVKVERGKYRVFCKLFGKYILRMK